MQNEIVISGFGGQGVLFTGQIIAYAALKEGKEVTWFPSYGPEMRGGTAHCTVIVATEEIGSPLVRHPKAVIAMNLPSLEKYEERIAPGGVFVLNSSLIDRSPCRTDLHIIEIRANEVAESLGEQRLANMVLLGAMLEHLPLVKFETLVKTLEERIPEKRAHLVEPNVRALKRGIELAYLEKTATVI